MKRIKLELTEDRLKLIVTTLNESLATLEKFQKESFVANASEQIAFHKRLIKYLATARDLTV